MLDYVTKVFSADILCYLSILLCVSFVLCFNIVLCVSVMLCVSNVLCVIIVLYVSIMLCVSIVLCVIIVLCISIVLCVSIVLFVSIVLYVSIVLFVSTVLCVSLRSLNVSILVSVFDKMSVIVICQVIQQLSTLPLSHSHTPYTCLYTAPSLLHTHTHTHIYRRQSIMYNIYYHVVDCSQSRLRNSSSIDEFR